MKKNKCNKILTKTQKKLKFFAECAVLDITDNRENQNVEKGREKIKRSK